MAQPRAHAHHTQGCHSPRQRCLDSPLLAGPEIMPADMEVDSATMHGQVSSRTLPGGATLWHGGQRVRGVPRGPTSSWRSSRNYARGDDRVLRGPLRRHPNVRVLRAATKQRQVPALVDPHAQHPPAQQRRMGDVRSDFLAVLVGARAHMHTRAHAAPRPLPPWSRWMLGALLLPRALLTPAVVHRALLQAMNPFESLPIYTEDRMAEYKGKALGRAPPHVYGTAEAAYRAASPLSARASRDDSGKNRDEQAPDALPGVALAQRWRRRYARGGDSAVQPDPRGVRQTRRRRATTTRRASASSSRF